MATTPNFSGFTPGANTAQQVLDAIRNAGLKSQWEQAASSAGNVEQPWRTDWSGTAQWSEREDLLKSLGWWSGGDTGGSGGTGGTGGTGGAGGTPTSPTGAPAPQMDMGWLNQGSLGGMLQGGQQASSQALPGLLNQPTQQGLLGGSPFYGSIPWGMMPQDIRTLMNSQAKRSLAQAPSKTTG